MCIYEEELFQFLMMALTTILKIHLQIVAGDQQSKKAATSISNLDSYFITSITTSVVSGSIIGQVMDFDLETESPKRSLAAKT